MNTIIKNNIGVGATKAFSLRVSIGTLVRVLFKNPENSKNMVALERTATLREFEGKSDVLVKAKPFGGGVRLTYPNRLKDLIGNFHYDSNRSREEGDFRIFIRPTSWEKIKEICKKHFREPEGGIFDSKPDHELVEEFDDSLKIKITPSQYLLKTLYLIIEDLPSESNNIRAQGFPTVRIYYIFEAIIKSAKIIKMMLNNSKIYSNENLKEMAWNDAKKGGKGRANAILAVDLSELEGIYNSLPLERRIDPVYVGENQLDGNIPAILGWINYPKYQRYIY
jgi:hypothetical protein